MMLLLVCRFVSAWRHANAKRKHIFVHVCFIISMGLLHPPRRPAPAPPSAAVRRPVRQLLEIALRGFDFDVLSAANGNEALEIYRLGGIDLVLMDVQMPVLDGPKTLARLKEINPEVVCCFMSAHIGRYEFDEIMGLGAIGFLQKPFHLEELRQMIIDAVG
jgi:CheY-like chemotaxis protein